jgi:hypothetical protein
MNHFLVSVLSPIGSLQESRATNFPRGKDEGAAVDGRGGECSDGCANDPQHRRVRQLTALAGVVLPQPRMPTISPSLSPRPTGPM